MSTFIPRRTRRISFFGAALALVISAVAFAGPAQAAIGVDLTVNQTTITEGESITLAWTSTDAVSIEASGDWTGSKAAAGGNEVVTPVGAGTKTYTLLATDENGREATDTVTVTVEEAVEGITPNPVTFPDECTVVVPETENVTYFVAYGDDDDEELDADTYEGIEFYNGDDSVTFYAVAADGFEFADGAITEWEYTASEECVGGFATLVKATATCGKVTFTNVADVTITVLYGDEDEEEPDGEFTLGAGKSRTVKTDRDLVLYVAIEGEEESFQVDDIEVPQNCGTGHPTVAPAAGVSQSGPGSPMPVLALLGLVALGATLRLRGSVR